MGFSLDKEEVKHIAHLARLRVSDEEVALYAAQLTDIIGYVNQLNTLDTSDVQPTSHALPITNVFRDDEPGSTLTPEEALSNAPKSSDDCFQVPKVLDQESA